MKLHSNSLRFLALGDSYTIGEAVDESQRWPNQFVTMMAENGIQFETPQIIATTGWTTDELAAAIDRENPQGPFDLVSLLIGVNNQYRGTASKATNRNSKHCLNGPLIMPVAIARKSS